MARRPLVFGAKLHEKGRTVRVRAVDAARGRYLVEDQHAGRATRRREHGSLGGALRDLASTWRGRLH